MDEHTPGPWVFYADLPSTEPNWHIVTTANRVRVLANVHIEPGNAMDLANARLIAAAPDLLEALTEMTVSFAEGVVWNDEQRAAYERARAALAKANKEEGG